MNRRNAPSLLVTESQSASAYLPRAWWRDLAGFARRKPLGAAGALAIIALTMIAVLAPHIAPYDPLALDSSSLLAAPRPSNLLGTDEFGRDVLSRLIYGARISLQVGLMAVGLGATVGAVLGLIGGYIGGRLDYVIQRIMDSLLAFPMLVLALALVAVLGSDLRNVILALAVVITPSASRVIRSSVLSIREMTYVESARAVGCTHLRVMFRHVLPNCVAPFIIVATGRLGSAILSEASLSFLGLGVPPPTPSWGAMLSGNTQRYMFQAPWLAIFPGLVITFTVFGFNLLGDALRDVLDPHLRGR